MEEISNNVVRSDERKAIVTNSRLLGQIEGKVRIWKIGSGNFLKESCRSKSKVDRSQRAALTSIFRCLVVTGSHVLRTFRGRTASYKHTFNSTNSSFQVHTDIVTDTTPSRYVPKNVSQSLTDSDSNQRKQIEIYWAFSQVGFMSWYFAVHLILSVIV